MPVSGSRENFSDGNIVVENISLTSKAKNAIARNLSFGRNINRKIASYNLNPRCPFDGQKHRISRAVLKHTFHINIFRFLVVIFGSGLNSFLKSANFRMYKCYNFLNDTFFKYFSPKLVFYSITLSSYC